MELFLPALTVWTLTIVVAVSARRLRPAAAACTLSVLAVSSAVAAAGSMAAVVAARLGHTPFLARPLGWCLSVAGARSTQAIALAAIAMLAAAAANVWRTARGQRRLLDPLGPDPLVVVDQAEPAAFALPRRRGCAAGQVVVSTGMLAALEPGERAALFAHERAHLRHRHHLLLRAAGLAAAACPLLRPLVRQVRHATERWADETAAVEVGDRAVVATAVLRAALAGSAHSVPPGALPFGGGSIAERVTALLEDNAHPPGASVASLAGTGAAAILAVTQLHHVATLAARLC